MKTFETEKHSIPEGATHYFRETENGLFAWWDEDNALLLCPDNSNHWEPPYIADDISSPIPIPQTKEVEWVNGDIVFIGQNEIGRFIGINPRNVNDCFVYSNRDGNAKGYHLHQLSKPETEAERVERERDELFKSAIKCIEKVKSVQDCNVNIDASFAIMTTVNAMIEAGYRKESE